MTRGSRPRLEHSIGLLSGRLRRVTATAKADFLRLAVDGVAAFDIALASDPPGRIQLAASDAGADAATIDACRDGPPLLLSLALQGRWCLHASGVATPVGVIAFCGYSGAGKSTLGRALGSAERGWRQVADDLLPLAWEDGRAVARPGYPALTPVPDREFPRNPADAVLPLAGVYVLSPPGEAAAAPGEEVRAEALGPAAALAALSEHTAALTLAPPWLRARHAECLAHFVQSIPVARLTYPRRLDALPRVAAAVAARLVEPRPAA